jgi:hypothetical protein
MTASPPAPRWPASRSPAVRIAGFLVLGLLGAAAGMGVATLSKEMNSGWEDTVALGAGAAPLALAVIIALLMATRRGADVIRGCGGLQVLVMGLAGVMMLLPIVGSRIASPGVIMAALAIMLVVQAGPICCSGAAPTRCCAGSWPRPRPSPSGPCSRPSSSTPPPNGWA